MRDDHCKTFDNAQQHALLKFINELRRIIDYAVEFDAPEEVLHSLQQQAVNIADTMQGFAGSKCLPQYNKEAAENDPNSFLPYSPVSGRFNPIAPPVEYERGGDKLLGHVTLGHAYEGPPKCVHGAVISAIYDQILAVANTLNGTGGPTAYLNVNFLKPTPLHQPIRFEAWVDREEGKKVFLTGHCYAGDELVSSCDSLFIKYNPKLSDIKPK